MDSEMDRALRLGGVQVELSLTLTGRQAQALAGPVVYIHRRGSEILYIGSSRIGLLRPFQKTHQHPVSDFRDGDRLDVYPLATEEEARALEKFLIAHFHPKYLIQVGRYNADRWVGRAPENG